MKMVKTSAGIALLLSLFLPVAWSGEVLDNIYASRLIRVATDSNWPPQSFLNAQNEMDGFDVDVAREIAARLGVAIRFVTPGWDSIVSGDWQNRWDLHVGSMKADSVSHQKLVFPAVYYYTPSVIAVHRDAKFDRLSQLNDKRIGAAIGTSQEYYLQRKLSAALTATPSFSYRIKNPVIKGYENSVYALDDLQAGNSTTLDAVIAGMPAVLDAIDKGSPIKILGKPLFYEPLVIGIEAGDTELHRKLSDIVDAMHGDGLLSKLSKKWYRVDYTVAD